MPRSVRFDSTLANEQSNSDSCPDESRVIGRHLPLLKLPNLFAMNLMQQGIASWFSHLFLLQRAAGLH